MSKPLILIVFLALLVRVVYVLYIPQVEVGADAHNYNQTAISLIEQGEFLDWKLHHKIIRPPGYPLFLAGVYLLSGYSYLAVRLWQVFFGALTAVFIYLICIRLFKKRKIALLACALAGLHPALIGYTGLLYTEAMFTFLLVVFIYFLQRAVLDGSYFDFAFSGIFLGLAALTSSRIMYFPFLFLMLCWFFPRSKKALIKQWLLVLSFMLLTVVPWTIRNYIVTGKVILLEEYHKAALWFATNPDDVHEWDKEQIQQIIKGRTQAEIQQAMYEEGKRHLKEHPFIYLKNSGKRFFRLWISGHSNIFSGLEKSSIYAWQAKDFKLFIIKFLFLIVNLSFLALGFLGIFLMGMKRLKDILVVLSPIIYLTFLHTFVIASPRLQVPMLPLLSIFTSYALVYMEERLMPINVSSK